jgi:hypothetical protein
VEGEAMWPFKNRGESELEGDSLEEKLKSLAECGFRLEEPFTVEDMLKKWSRKQSAKPGFEMVLVGLGDFESQPPWRPFCRNLWHFDTECIEDEGSYVRIAERMMEMADGSLKLDSIRDHVDIEEEVAWLEFEHEGRLFHIDCEVNNDWVDPAVFAPFVGLLEKTDPNKLFLYYGLFGQDCILACATETQYRNSRSAGINFEPLKAEKLR